MPHLTRAPALWSVALAAVGVAGAALGLARGVGADAEGFRVRRTPVVAAVERAAPAVVNITTDSRTWQGGGVRGTGSGVLVHPSGYVVTNSHVARGASRIFVETSQAAGGQRLEAALVEDDPGHDLALLRVTRSTPFPYVALAASNDLMVGETAVAIGNPMGLGETVTVGIISALRRSAEMPTGYTIRNLIQTDASINRGNSGGALLNLEGALIGINSSTFPGAQGISFTVPADDVRAMLERNLGGTPRPPPKADDVSAAPPIVAIVSPPSFAAPGAADAPRKPAGIGLSLKTTSGFVLVTDVQGASPAEIGGLKPGDAILEIDGITINSAADVSRTFAASPPGKPCSVELVRDGKRKRAIVVAPNP